jgi:SOS-response transcriptional repressor LexA
MPKLLTERRQKILHYICSHIEQKNYPPTVKKIGDHVGLVSIPFFNGDHIDTHPTSMCLR